jgi:hypothetical protein
LVRTATGQVAAVPLVARIHEGLVETNRDRRTLLDRLVELILRVAGGWDRKVLLVADSYYASGKVIQPLLKKGHHLLTRARVNTVAYQSPRRRRKRRRGRPRIYGAKVRLRDLVADHTVPSPLTGEAQTRIRYGCVDLLWRPVGHRVRFIRIEHPHRGTLILMTTDLTLDPLDALLLYSYRFKIETGFRQAIHVIGAYAYHFWMETMTPIHRRSKDQYLHRKSDDYRRNVHRKMKAYHVHVQLGCIAQGLLIHLAIHHGDQVWQQFRSWLRTMDPSRPPSELVVAYALRESLPEFLADGGGEPELRKIAAAYRTSADPAESRKAG